MFNIVVIQVCATTRNADEAEVGRFCEDMQDLLELTPKRCPFHFRGLDCKSRKSRNTWGNRQIWPWSTEWSRAKANRVLPRECTGHSKHPLPTTQERTGVESVSRAPLRIVSGSQPDPFSDSPRGLRQIKCRSWDPQLVSVGHTGMVRVGRMPPFEKGEA